MIERDDRGGNRDGDRRNDDRGGNRDGDRRNDRRDDSQNGRGGDSTVIEIDPSRVGLIIGRGGSTIRDYTERLKVKIDIGKFDRQLIFRFG